jgi:hypothetical protein
MPKSMVTNENQIPYIKLDATALKSVTTRALKRGKLNAKTLMGGDGNATGFTGEELVRAYVPGLIQEPEHRDYDFYFPVAKPGDVVHGGARVTTPLNITFDVKSRKIRVAPRLNFDCKIPLYQAKRQKCDAYIFTAPQEDLTGGWLLGWMTKEEFLNEATLFKKGYKHPSGIELKEDHLFITVGKLHPMDELRRQTQQIIDTQQIRSVA